MSCPGVVVQDSCKAHDLTTEQLGTELHGVDSATCPVFALLFPNVILGRVPNFFVPQCPFL